MVLSFSTRPMSSRLWRTQHIAGLVLLGFLGLLALGMLSPPDSTASGSKGAMTPSAPAADSVRLDVSGLSLFWQMADTLQRGRLPSPAAWTQLFSHPGYALPVNLAQRDDELKTCITAVFHPQARSRLDSLRTRGTRLEQRICSHLERARLHQDQLQAYVDTLTQQALPTSAKPLAAQYLPTPLPDTIPAPQIYVILNEPTNWGWSGEIALDLLDVMERPQRDVVYTLAHEMHHAYMSPFYEVDLPDRADPAYSILQPLERMRSEGVASLIDKRRFVGIDTTTLDYAPNRSVAAGITRGMQETPRALAQVDSILTRLHQGAVSQAEAGAAMQDALWDVTYHPHVSGLYMAMRIEDELGRARLIRASRNLFRFVEAYREAGAQDANRPTLSEPAWEALRALERAS